MLIVLQILASMGNVLPVIIMLTVNIVMARIATKIMNVNLALAMLDNVPNVQLMLEAD